MHSRPEPGNEIRNASKHRVTCQYLGVFEEGPGRDFLQKVLPRKNLSSALRSLLPLLLLRTAFREGVERGDVFHRAEGAHETAHAACNAFLDVEQDFQFRFGQAQCLGGHSPVQAPQWTHKSSSRQTLSARSSTTT